MRIVYDVNHMKSVKFEADGLASIIVGPRMSDEDEERLRNLVVNSKMPHITITRARLSTNSYSVEIALPDNRAT